MQLRPEIATVPSQSCETIPIVRAAFVTGARWEMTGLDPEIRAPTA